MEKELLVIIVYNELRNISKEKVQELVSKVLKNNERNVSKATIL